MAEKKDPIRNLIDSGRRAGKLTSTEISDAMEEAGNVLEVEAMEKLYEELLMDSERDKMTRTAHKKIFVANVDKIDDAQYDHMMQVLQTVEDKNDERAVEAIAEIVPTYHPDEKNRPDNKAELLQKNENQAAG